MDVSAVEEISLVGTAGGSSGCWQCGCSGAAASQGGRPVVVDRLSADYVLKIFCIGR